MKEGPGSEPKISPKQKQKQNTYDKTKLLAKSLLTPPPPSDPAGDALTIWII